MGKKKSAALNGATKKERAKLEARAAEIKAELKAREKAAAKKAAKKSSKKAPNSITPADESRAARKKASKKIDRSKVKKAKAVDVGPIGLDPSITITAEPEAAVTPGAPTPEEITAAERAKPLNADEMRERVSSDTDAALKAKIEAKRQTRAELAAEAETIDRADADAVRDYNARAVVVGLTLLTSDAEKAKVKARNAKPTTSSDKDKGGLVAAAEAHAATIDLGTGEVTPAVEIIETETGREFVAGESVASSTYDFAKPSEAPKADFESKGLGQYLVMRPDDGKLVGYTRVTSYIRGIEDDAGIVKWKQRVLLVGVAAADELVATGEAGDSVTAGIRELAHVRDVAIAKARKLDRKGKLAPGELVTYVEGAWRDFKRAMDRIADDLFELGGGREKASKGTDLHALFELHDREGMQAVADLATLGQITPADLADVEAYAELVSSWGIDFVDIERVVVNDSVAAPTPSKPGRVIGVAGRLDRTGYVKLPGETRRRKRVIDVKTGSLDYSKAEISRQLASYAMSKGYDLDTHEREDMKLDQKTAVVIHLPAGSAKAELWAVDLAAGRKGLKIIADMRANRNEGKLAMTLVEHERSVD